MDIKMLEIILSPCCQSKVVAQGKDLYCSNCNRIFDKKMGFINMIQDVYPCSSSILRKIYETDLGVSFYRIFRDCVLSILGASTGGEDFEALLVESVIKIESGCNILDLSCGPGIHMKWLAANNPSAKFYGIDISSHMLSRAVQNMPNNTLFIRSDAGTLPFVDASLDGVYCLGALYLYPHREMVLKEISRVLKPSGYMVGVYFRSRSTGFRDHLLQLLFEMIGISVSTEEAILDEISNVGFFPNRIRTMNHICILVAQKG